MNVEDLLYGMMLPSGNDAALTLAENLGAVLYFDKSGNKEMI
jgi:D-alanyl-D-alanine carboxypeptidase